MRDSYYSLKDVQDAIKILEISEFFDIEDINNAWKKSTKNYYYLFRIGNISKDELNISLSNVNGARDLLKSVDSALILKALGNHYQFQKKIREEERRKEELKRREDQRRKELKLKDDDFQTKLQLLLMKGLRIFQQAKMLYGTRKLFKFFQKLTIYFLFSLLIWVLILLILLLIFY